MPYAKLWLWNEARAPAEIPAAAWLLSQAGGACTLLMVQSANGTGRSGPAAYGDPQPARQEDLSWPVYSRDGRLQPPFRPAEPPAAAAGGTAVLCYVVPQVLSVVVRPPPLSFRVEALRKVGLAQNGVR
jgi:hypothetical protein